MSKSGPTLDALNKIVKRLIKAAPNSHAEKLEPLARLVRAFLEFDCDSNRLLAASVCRYLRISAFFMPCSPSRLI